MGDRITEFVTVLSVAVLVGGAAMLAMRYLDAFPRAVTIAILAVTTIIVWQYLRRRFGRR